jgi:hypothetical protein
MRLPDHIRDAQNDVFDQQLALGGLLAAAFWRKYGSVRMTVQFSDDGESCIHEPVLAEPAVCAEPLVWKARAEQCRRVCDIPPEECIVVTRYLDGGRGTVGFERKRMPVLLGPIPEAKE